MKTTPTSRPAQPITRPCYQFSCRYAEADFDWACIEARRRDVSIATVLNEALKFYHLKLCGEV